VTVPDPLQEDRDLDDVGDLCDNCVNDPNTPQVDTDLDGEGDVCDDDDDGDGVLDPMDNCQFVANNGQANVDGDAFGAACDCDDGQSDAWSLPENVQLAFARDPSTGRADISWAPPADPGGSVPVRYDLIRTDDPTDLLIAAACLETDETDTAASDTTLTASRGVLFYLVRTENDCPAAGSLGLDSDGAERVGLTCP
jgi:hypothetical protein